MIAIVDYGMGNVRSVRNALDHLRVQTRLVGDPEGVAGADRLLIPGVGAFGDAMAALRERGLVEPLRRAAADGRPILGVCLGMQLLAEVSDEHGEHEGLGLIPGRVRGIPPAPGIRVPHVGWNVLEPRGASPLLDGVAPEPTFYFVHSFHLEPADAGHVGGVTHHGRPLVAYVRAGSVHGVQFHPEKSQRDGLALLAAFARLS